MTMMMLILIVTFDNGLQRGVGSIGMTKQSKAHSARGCGVQVLFRNKIFGRVIEQRSPCKVSD